MGVMQVAVLPEEIADALWYAEAAEPHTLKKLDCQRSKFSHKTEMNHLGHRIARSVVSRVLREHGIDNECDMSPHTVTTEFCIRTPAGAGIQVRFIRDRPNYRRLPEDVYSFKRRPHDFYVAVTSSDDLNAMASIRILGFATRAELGRYPPTDFGQGIRNQWVWISSLRDISELLAVLRSADWRAACQRLAAPSLESVTRIRKRQVRHAG